MHAKGRPASSKTRAARHALLAGQSWKDPIIMTHAAPPTVSVPVDLLEALLGDASLLAAKVGTLLEACDVEIAPATVLPDNVYRLDNFRRSRRQAVS